MLDRTILVPAYSQAGVRKTRLLKNSFYQAFVKRALDVFFVLLALPMVAPLIAILAVVVARDGGSPLYYQMRVGKNGKVFKCWKLRSMIVDADARLKELCAKDPLIAAEWAANQKLRNDPRITRVGRIARKTSIDELPQIWNVLIGDMSLVGPRPFAEDQRALYEKAGGRLYYSVRPGLTGLWQVYGRGTTLFTDRVRFDDRYAVNLSLGADLRLIFITVPVLLRQTGH